MDKNRMQKLAGINEGTNFFNGKLVRYDNYQDEAPDGNWCYDGDVAKLEAIASEMYDILSKLDTPEAKAVLKKAQSL